MTSSGGGGPGDLNHEEMSFNHRAVGADPLSSSDMQTQQQTLSTSGLRNKENIDSMISKFRLENQAFSNRVQNVKSKIDNAYHKFLRNDQKKTATTQMNSPRATTLLMANKSAALRGGFEEQQLDIDTSRTDH